MKTSRPPRRRPGRRITPAPSQPYAAHLGITALLCLVALGAVHGPTAATTELPARAAAHVPAREPLPVVNKTRPLKPASYEPPDLAPVSGTLLRADAAAALESLVAGAARDGVAIIAVSGYRSYATQQGLYARYTDGFGQTHTDALSARPGFSEHQTGLAVDVGNPDGSCALLGCFASTPAGAWAAANAPRFGFIVRYPEGASAVTGYAYEPWHLRYVGPKAAAEITRRGLTLEAYEGLPPAPSY
jgi:D-alanyl-D-alanine carboxypeptidase